MLAVLCGWEKLLHQPFFVGPTGCWETVLIPKDKLGPSHVIYFPDRVEVRRYWIPNGCVELAATFRWDDPQLMAKVLIAATEDICADWSLVG